MTSARLPALLHAAALVAVVVVVVVVFVVVAVVIAENDFDAVVLCATRCEGLSIFVANSYLPISQNLKVISSSFLSLFFV